MFYSESQLKFLIICRNCNQQFNDPRFLPCGYSMCNECIISLSRNQTSFNCVLCSELHNVPKEGFATNRTLMELYSIKPKEVYRSKLIADFKSNLNQMKSRIDDLEEMLKNSEFMVREYCDFVISDIEIVSESTIEHITKCRDHLLEKVNGYKNKLLDRTHNNQTPSDTQEKISKSINETKEFYNKWNKYLEEFEIDDQEINKAILESKEKLVMINKDKLNLKRKLFDGELLEFNQNEIDMNDLTFLGKINFKQLSAYIDIESLNMKKLNKYILINHTLNNQSLLDFVHLNDGNILAALVTDKITISFILFDSNMKLVTVVEERRGHKFIINVLKCSLVDGQIIMYSCDERSIAYMNSFTIKANQLQIKKYTKIETPYLYVTSNSSNVYCISRDFSIKIYSSNLEHLKSISITEPPIFDTQYFEKSKQIEVSDSYYFVLDSAGYVSILNINNGSMVKSFATEANKFAIFKKSYVITFNEESKILAIYDLGGSKKQENVIDGFRPDIIKSQKDKFLFFDYSLKSVFGTRLELIFLVQ